MIAPLDLLDLDTVGGYQNWRRIGLQLEFHATHARVDPRQRDRVREDIVDRLGLHLPVGRPGETSQPADDLSGAERLFYCKGYSLVDPVGW